MAHPKEPTTAIVGAKGTNAADAALDVGIEKFREAIQKATPAKATPATLIDWIASLANDAAMLTLRSFSGKRLGPVLLTLALAGNVPSNLTAQIDNAAQADCDTILVARTYVVVALDKGKKEIARWNFRVDPKPKPEPLSLDDLDGGELLDKLLGSLAADGPANEALRKRLALTRPVLSRVPPQRAQDAQLGFGPVDGKVGEIKTITVQPQVYFRGEKLIAVDTAEPQGSGTEIVNVFIGNEAQFSQANASILSMVFGPGSLGSGIAFKPAQPAITISIVVRFRKDCTWNAVLFGKAIR